MKKRNLKSLKINKRCISKFDNQIQGGGASFVVRCDPTIACPTDSENTLNLLECIAAPPRP